MFLDGGRVSRPGVSASQRLTAGGGLAVITHRPRRTGRLPQPARPGRKPSWRPPRPDRRSPARVRFRLPRRDNSSISYRRQTLILDRPHRHQVDSQVPTHQGLARQPMYREGRCMHEVLVGAHDLEGREVLFNPSTVIYQGVRVGRAISDGRTLLGAGSGTNPSPSRS